MHWGARSDGYLHGTKKWRRRHDALTVSTNCNKQSPDAGDRGRRDNCSVRQPRAIRRGATILSASKPREYCFHRGRLPGTRLQLQEVKKISVGGLERLAPSSSAFEACVTFQALDANLEGYLRNFEGMHFDRRDNNALGS